MSTNRTRRVADVSAVLGCLRELQRAHILAVVVVHARKNGGTTGGQSLRGSSDFFAWVDTALSLRRHRQHLLLSAEHRAARVRARRPRPRRNLP